MFARVFSSNLARQVSQRTYSVSAISTAKTTSSKKDSTSWKWGALLGGVASASLLSDNFHAFSNNVDYKKIREEIADILEEEDYDDGSYGPVFVRLAWHQSGTYSKDEKNGGSDGANIRHSPEKDHGANAGLGVAMDRLEAIKKKHPEISYADLYILASVVAIEEMGGPKINFIPGRRDTSDNSKCTPDGRLPDASQGRDHIREVFYRMGLNDEEIVALVGGGHAIGRCHTDRSGFTGPWTNSPTTFSNDYFVQLLNNKWTKKQWNGPEQYEDPTGTLMMLPADMELKFDPEFRKYSEIFAADEEHFFKVFATAYAKLTNLGREMRCPHFAHKE